MNTDLQIIEGALVEFDKVEAGLAILEKNYKGVLFDVETPEGMAFCKQAWRNVREPRIGIEKVRKTAKAPILNIGKSLDSRAQAITMRLLALEEPLHDQIKNEEQREAREAKALADRLEAFCALPLTASGRTADHARSVLAAAQATDVTGLDAERVALTLIALKGVVTERETFEIDQARIQAERAELEKLRSLQAKRDAAELRRQNEQARAKAAARAEEYAAQQAVLAKERAVLVEAELKVKAELDALARQAAAQAAEAARLAEAAKPKPAPVAPKNPTLADMAKVLAAHYQVPEQTAYGWLREAFNKLSEQWVA